MCVHHLVECAISGIIIWSSGNLDPLCAGILLLITCQVINEIMFVFLITNVTNVTGL